MKQVALFFTWRAFGAGTTTFTAHLYKGFQDIGVEPYIYRIRPNSETFTRPFSKFEGVVYRNVSPEQAVQIAKDMPSLLTAPCPAKHLVDPEIIHKLIKNGMRVVLHGELDYRVHLKLNTLSLIQNPFVVRHCLKKHFNRAQFIPHPYVRTFDKSIPDQLNRKYNAVSIARTTFIKNTDIILEANKALIKKYRVSLRGAEDRMYIQHKLRPKYPDFRQLQSGFPPAWNLGARACAEARYAVDMSDGRSNGGGGTQYTYLEAWDAGTVNIVNSDWLNYEGIMEHKINCFGVESAYELADILMYGLDSRLQYEIILNGRDVLVKHHDAATVAKQYWRNLNK